MPITSKDYLAITGFALEIEDPVMPEEQKVNNLMTSLTSMYPTGIIPNFEKKFTCKICDDTKLLKE